MVWRKGMKILSWVFFVALLIGSLVVAFIVGDSVRNGGLLGFAVFLGGGVFAFLSVAVVMIFVGMAEDVAAIRKTCGRAADGQSGNTTQDTSNAEIE